MEKYPQKTCSIDRLVRQPKLVQAALEGRKIEQRRDGVYGWPGEKFILAGREFVITGLERQRLGDMSNADAIAEGFASLDAYKDVIMRMHPGMTWISDGLVWVHRFALADAD